MKWTAVVGAVVVAGTVAGPWCRAGAFETPDRVEVLPIYFVPKGQREPAAKAKDDFDKHIDWARTRYAELLGGETFTRSGREAVVCQGKQTIDFYRKLPESGIPVILGEVLDTLKMNRRNCPYVLTVLVSNAKDSYPNGYGQPMNGGYNTGGGVFVISSFQLERSPNFQSTVQHELGHCFGLPHVDAYGYDMKTSASLMSYNPGHWTKGFTASKTPGRFIPEDVRGLALNKRIFPNLRFDPASVPDGYHLASIVPLGIPAIPNDPCLLKVKAGEGRSPSGDPAVIVQNRTAAVDAAFDKSAMWQGYADGRREVSVRLDFPGPITLDRVRIDSRCAGGDGAVAQVQVVAETSKGVFRTVAAVAGDGPQQDIAFAKTEAKSWGLKLVPKNNNYVILRGLRFYAGDREQFQALIPDDADAGGKQPAGERTGRRATERRP